jgi:hypothetical protein
MVSRKINPQLLEELEKLSPALQDRVLAFARALASTRRGGVTGESLLRFAGAIDPKDLDLMSRAIEEGCERIDPNAW